MIMFQLSPSAKILPLLLAVTITLTTLVDGAFSPARISFESLVQPDNASRELFLRSLRNIGMISVTDIPYFDSKWETLNTLPACMNDSFPEWALEHTFSDGTRRQTLASHSVGNIHAASPVPVADSDSCAAFTEASQTFRQVVGLVLAAFAEQLAEVLNLDDTKPVLMDKSSIKPYSLVDIFEGGDQLDHFHCYYSSEEEDSSFAPGEDTIEWHTDQGLALVFTPGSTDGKPTDGFYIQLEDGSTEMVDFQKKDDLVILLGDGVNQYLNRVIDADHSLRALPHSLRMPISSSSDSVSPRVWYGRMVLPPSAAMHPFHPFTFGEIREQMIIEDGGSMIGCSEDLVARELYETTCEDGVASYCWHRCMNFTEYGVSPEICADQQLDLACINEEGYLWPGNHDPAFSIGCIDLSTAENFTIMDDSHNDNDHGETTNGDDHEHDSATTSSGVGFHSGRFALLVASISFVASTF